jgi:hypothetical protein
MEAIWEIRNLVAVVAEEDILEVVLVKARIVLQAEAAVVHRFL